MTAARSSPSSKSDRMEPTVPRATTAPQPPPPIAPALDFFAGTVAGASSPREAEQGLELIRLFLPGVASLLCGHPFDTSASPSPARRRRADPILLLRAVKVRLQCQSKEGGYRNAMHAFRSILQAEQVRSRAGVVELS